jgi:hypothetical protein
VHQNSLDDLHSTVVRFQTGGSKSYTGQERMLYEQ